MLTLDRNEFCVAPRELKSFVFPVSNVSEDTCAEKPDFILKPSVYRKFQKLKKTSGGALRSKSKSNKLKKKAHLAYLTNLALKPPKVKTLTLHLAGIGATLDPSRHTRLQLDGIDMETIITVKSGLKPSNNIDKLKQFIHNTFNVPSSHDLLILYSHIVISLHNESKLSDFGITNKSLLLIAITARHKSYKSHSSRSKHLFDEQKVNFKNKISCPSIDRLDIKALKGFDVITQESNVDVYRMPVCGHVMSTPSLYHYALTQFEDKHNLHLTCPHTEESKEEKKYEEDPRWPCDVCTFLNKENDTKCVVCETPKPWCCDRCTFINHRSHQKCEMCGSKAPQAQRNDAVTKDDGLCREIWDYSLLKSLLITKPKDASCDGIQHEVKKKEIHQYYALRHEYSRLRQQYEAIPIEFEQRIRQTQKRLIDEFQMSDKTELNRIRKKAKKDAALDKFNWPNTKKLDRKRVWRNTAKLELLSARNNIQNKYGLQTCPKCCTLYYKDRKPKRGRLKKLNKMTKYRTRCAMCASQSFCFSCGQAWQSGHLCDSQFRSQLVGILKSAETKQIGEVKDVPTIRGCPKCCQLITHTEACKHMECRSCKTKFCFVCMKLYKDGAWQCGSSGARCPIAPRQDMKTLPNIIAINEESFQLF